MRIRILLLALLTVVALSAQSKKIVILGGSDDVASELQRTSPSGVTLVHVSNPRDDSEQGEQ